MQKENKCCLFFISGLAVNILAFVEGLCYNYSSCSVKATTDNRQKSEQGSVPVKFIFTKASTGTVRLLTGLCWTLVLTTHTVLGWFSWTKYLLKTYYMWSPGDKHWTRGTWCMPTCSRKGQHTKYVIQFPHCDKIFTV